MISDGNNYNNINKNNDNDYDHTDYKEVIITIEPKEESLTDTILSELSIINNIASKQQNIPIMKHIIIEYISVSKTLLENDKKEKFYLLTNWISQNLLHSIVSFEKEFQNEVLTSPLLDFQNYISQKYEYAKDNFDIYMRIIFKI